VRWSGRNDTIKDAVASRDREANGDVRASDPRQFVFPNEVVAVDSAPHVAVTQASGVGGGSRYNPAKHRIRIGRDTRDLHSEVVLGIEPP
jgi:hypothetical protein